MTTINGNVPAPYAQMVCDLSKSGQAIIDSLTPHKAHLLHMAVGIAGELGEKLEALIANDMVNLREECGDLEFYLQGYVHPLSAEFSALPAELVSPAAVDAYIESLKTQNRRELVQIIGMRLLDYTKKLAVYNKPLDVQGVALQVAALRFLLDNLYEVFAMTRDDVLDGNMNKLLKGDTARYKSGTYSDEQAQARADKANERVGVVAVTINGKVHELTAPFLPDTDVGSLTLSYEQVLELAGYTDTSRVRTVTYSLGHMTGALSPVGVLALVGNQKNIINVADTNNA